MLGPRLASSNDRPTNYPPYNIEHLTRERNHITMAVAGFGKEDVKIKVKRTHSQSKATEESG